MKRPPDTPEIADEPGMAERFQRGLQRAFNTPAIPHKPPTRKLKERPVRKGRVRKGETRDR